MSEPTTAPTAGGDQTATPQEIAEQVRALMRRLREATAPAPDAEAADDPADDATRELTRTLRDVTRELGEVLTHLGDAYETPGPHARAALRLTDAGGAIKTAVTDLGRALDAM